MRKHLSILNYTGITLLRHWKSTISLIIVFAFIIFTFASILFFIQSLSYESQQLINSIPEIKVQRIEGGRLVPIENDLIDDAKKIRGVTSVQKHLWGYYYDPVTNGVFTIIASDSMPYETHLIRGRQIIQTDSEGVAICGTGYLETHHIDVDSIIVLFDAERTPMVLRVIGAFTSESDLLTRDLIIVTKNDARWLLGVSDGYSTEFSVRVINPNEIENVSHKITKKLRSVRVVTRSDIQATYKAIFGYRGSLFQFGLLMSLLAFIILAWQRAGGLTPSVKREIGIQKAVGWTISDVLIQKFWEGIIISVNATLAGIIAAYLHVFIFDSPILKPFLVGWSVIYPSFHIKPHIEPTSILLIICFSVAPYLAATIIPSWKSAISDPSDVMHA